MAKGHLMEIKDIPFFHDLSPADLKIIEKCLVEKSFAKGELIHSEGADCTRIFFVRSGRVKIFRSSLDGKEQIFEVLKAGDTCACNPGNRTWHCSSSAEALEPTKLWYLSREIYVKMVEENSRLMRALNELFARRLECFTNIIEDMSLKDSKKRLVKFLLDLIPNNSKDNQQSVLFIQSTREEIAHRLGTARETVARHISDLKRKKIIDVKPYQIVILDKAALEKLLQ